MPRCAHRGLRLEGATYVLKLEDDFHGRMGTIRQLLDDWQRHRMRLDEELVSLGRWERRYRELSEPRGPAGRFDGPGPPPDRGPGPPGDGPPPPPDGMPGFGPSDRGGPPGPPRDWPDRRRIDRLRNELEARLTLSQFTAADLAGRLEVTLGEIRRRRDDLVALRPRIAARYAELAAEAPVKDALLALNRAGTDPLSLGTGLGLSEDLRRMDATLDRTTIPVRNATTRIEWKGEDRLRGLVGAADLLLHQVAIDLGHLGTLEHEDRSRRKMLAEQRLKDPRRSDTPAAAGTDPAESERIAGERRAVGTRVESLSAEQVRGHRAVRELLDELAARQALFLRVVDAVRGSIEPAAPSREGSTAGTASRGTTAAPTTSRSIPQNPAADPFARRLKELEKLIRSERVAVDVDRALVWVDATLDGTHHLKMIVNSRAADMRLAAGTAAAAGIRPLDGEPAVEITTLEGRKVPARRARLETVQVGACILRDVNCLVLPPEFGEAPPVLGGTFLKRISTRLDRDAGTMILTQIQVKPILRADRAAGAR